MEEKDERAFVNKCLPQVGPQKIIMRQVVGQRSKQKSLDVHMCVPRRRPGIEQIIDVFVKKVRITSVDIITDKVIVRGHFEVKAIYVACLPKQPVHAIEMRRVRFTVDVPIYGARCGMDADASVDIEFVDYDCDDKTRLYKHKYDKKKDYGHKDCDDDCKPHHHDNCDDHCEPHHHKDCDCDDHCKPHHHDDCDDNCKPHYHHNDCDCNDGCKMHHYHDDCDDNCKPHHHHKDWDDCCKPHHHHKHDCCAREFDVSIVLRVTAKVMTDREVVIGNNYYPGLPLKPKG
ncbi:DUF3794 domain-containing protein [Dendrosporobacter sp. 1207_IL3150]|uniref:DUF3794 domain-containing protein n=1 Tax=Dendrosporobacter sp. 1207_IL3150 TaxID=3084054 RepID=UPI002FD9228C